VKPYYEHGDITMEPTLRRRIPESVCIVCLEDRPVEKVTEYFITSAGHYLVLIESGESLRFDEDGYFPPSERGTEVKSRLKFRDEVFAFTDHCSLTTDHCIQGETFNA
jgi:hypothetical protein